jgi:hypothetical protein
VGRGAQPLVVAGLVGQIREQVAQPSAGEPQPAPFAVAAEQDLGDRQTDQLGVRQLGAASRSEPRAEVVVDGDVECDDEVVETGVHEASLEVEVARATPTLGGLVRAVTPCHPRLHSESTI